MDQTTRAIHVYLVVSSLPFDEFNGREVCACVVVALGCLGWCLFYGVVC